jgi:hypothetical protein
MCDIGADAVWDSEGACCCADSLPISEALRSALRLWQEAYDAAVAHPDDHVDGYFKPGFHLLGHSQWGLQLARRVKAELPDWTVIYHDEWVADNLPRNWQEQDRIKFEHPV